MTVYIATKIFGCYEEADTYILGVFASADGVREKFRQDQQFIDWCKDDYYSYEDDYNSYEQYFEDQVNDIDIHEWEVE